MPQQEPSIAPPPEAMVNAMLEPRPDRRAWPRMAWWSVALVMLCLLPRAGVAAKQTVICRDGVYYLQLADALAQRDWARGFNTLGLNVYPTLLATFDALGFDAPTAGKWWGVVIASLTVLPLFGWVRRLFNDRVAWTVAVLYAAHPKLIEWSPELVRDPTFWFLWTTSIYCLVRAVNEVRLGWFLLAGIATALTVHTRFEGWLLYLPWVGWTWYRGRHLLAERWALTRGAMAGVLAYPALLLLVNVTWLHDCPDWQLGSFQRLQYVRWWWQGGAPGSAELAPRGSINSEWLVSNVLIRPQIVRIGGERVRSTPATHGFQGASTARQSLRRVAHQSLAIASAEGTTSRQFTVEYLDALRRGFHLSHGLLAAWGIWRWRRLWTRPDYYALLVPAIAIFAAIWIHFWYAGATSSRYVLTVLLVALPWTALGLLDLVAIATAQVRKLRPAWNIAPRAAVAVTMSFCFSIGAAQAIASRDQGSIREAALGQWLGDTLGAETPVALAKTMPLCAYYAGPAQQVTWLDTRDEAWPAMLQNHSLAVAIVEAHAWREDRAAALHADWTRLEASDLPEECRAGKFVVLVRRAALGASSAADAARASRDDAAMRFRKAPVGR